MPAAPIEPIDGAYTTPRGRRIAADAVSWVATRSGGPGGQHANTSDTAVTVSIEVALTGLPDVVRERIAAAVGPFVTATSARSRSQWRNRQLAWQDVLARLDEAYPDSDLLVLPINVDATPDGLADARSFIDVHEPLPLYSDMKFQLPFELPGEGKMPQTVLLDRQGRIRASFSGEADWASPEARALIDALLAEPVA